MTVTDWSIKRVTPASLLAVSIPEVKAQARVDIDEDDALLERKIKAATEYAEAVQNRALLTSTWRMTLDCFPCWEIRLMMPPLQSVTSITYVDTDGTTQTLSSSAYLVSADSEPGRITPAYGYVWPAVRHQPEAVKITYIAGYTAASLVPVSTREGILALAATMYEFREMLVSGTIVAKVPDIASLLDAESFRNFSGPLGGGDY